MSLCKLKVYEFEQRKWDKMWGYWEQRGDAWELWAQHWENIQNKFRKHM
jgi:hypothetical protein